MVNGHAISKCAEVELLLFYLMDNVKNANPLRKNTEINVTQNSAKRMRNNFPVVNVRNVKILKLFPLMANSASSNIVSQGKLYYLMGDAKIVILMKSLIEVRKSVFCHFVVRVTI